MRAFIKIIKQMFYPPHIEFTEQEVEDINRALRNKK